MKFKKTPRRHVIPPHPHYIIKYYCPSKTEEENKNKKFVIIYLVMALYRITQNSRDIDKDIQYGYGYVSYKNILNVIGFSVGKMLMLIAIVRKKDGRSKKRLKSYDIKKTLLSTRCIKKQF